MRDERLSQDEVRDARKEQHQTVERDRPWRFVILAYPSGRERRERQPEQQMQIGPQDRSGNALGSVQEMMMIVPVDADVNEAQDVAQKDRNRGPKRFERRPGRHPEVKDHDGDDDREDAVTEGFETPFVHRRGFWSTRRRLSRIASATSSRR